MSKKSGRRGRIEIRILALKHIDRGVSKPSNLFYKLETNTSYGKMLLRDLIAKKLVREKTSQGWKTYFLTEKGLMVLDLGLRLLAELV